MTAWIEKVARDNLLMVLGSQMSSADIDPGLDMSANYGLTSLNKVLFMMSVCGDTGVDLGTFTEADVAAMRTLDDVVSALGKHAPQGI
jgi:hypothetical protein